MPRGHTAQREGQGPQAKDPGMGNEESVPRGQVWELGNSSPSCVWKVDVLLGSSLFLIEAVLLGECLPLHQSRGGVFRKTPDFTEQGDK